MMRSRRAGERAFLGPFARAVFRRWRSCAPLRCPASPKACAPCPHCGMPPAGLLPCREEAEEGTEQAEEEEDGSSAGGGGGLSFWGVASVLTATVKAKTAEVLTAVQDTDWRAELEAFQQVGAGMLQGASWKAAGRDPGRAAGVRLACTRSVGAAAHPFPLSCTLKQKEGPACIHQQVRLCLCPIGLQGAKEDAEAVTKGADAALHKAVAAAEHLPGALEQLPGSAGAALPVLQARAGAAAEAAKVQVGAAVSMLSNRQSAACWGPGCRWQLCRRRMSCDSRFKVAHALLDFPRVWECVRLPAGCSVLRDPPSPPQVVQAGRSLANLAGLGSKIVLGTHDLFEQIRWARLETDCDRAEASLGKARRACSAQPSAVLPSIDLPACLSGQHWVMPVACSQAARDQPATLPALPRNPAAATRCRTRWPRPRAAAPAPAAARPLRWAPPAAPAGRAIRALMPAWRPCSATAAPTVTSPRMRRTLPPGWTALTWRAASPTLTG